MKINIYISVISIVLAVNIGVSQDSSKRKAVLIKTGITEWMPIHPIKTDSVSAKLKNGVHLVARVSENKIGLDDKIEIEYRLYVSQDIGIKNWELVEEPIYDGFKSETIKLDDLKVETVNYKGESYRMVVFKKDILQAKDAGDYQIAPLKLSVTAEIFMGQKTDDDYNTPSKTITKIFRSNASTVKVEG